MLRPSDNDPGCFRPSHLNNVATATFLRNQSNPAMIPTVWHPLLNSRIDHDSDRLTQSIGDKQSPKRLLASVPGLPANQGPSLCPETLGTSQQPILRWRKLRARRFRIYVRDIASELESLERTEEECITRLGGSERERRASR